MRICLRMTAYITSLKYVDAPVGPLNGDTIDRTNAVNATR